MCGEGVASLMCYVAAASVYVVRVIEQAGRGRVSRVWSTAWAGQTGQYRQQDGTESTNCSKEQRNSRQLITAW